MDKTLIVMVGLPRSGKSTWAKEQGYPIVNTDSIRMALYGKPFIAEAEEMVWTIAKIMVKSLFIAGHNTVIMDATHTRKNLRNKWRSINWTTKFKVLKTNKKICMERALNNNQLELIPIIEKMSNFWEDVDIDEEGEIIV